MTEPGIPESSIVVRPEPVGTATYTSSSRLQAAGLAPAVALFEQAAAAVPLPNPPHPVVIADYGASTEHNSLLPVSAAIATLRRHTRPEHAILVTHTDLPSNDFTALFNTLADDPDSYLHTATCTRMRPASPRPSGSRSTRRSCHRTASPSAGHRGRLVVLTMAVGDDGEFGYRPLVDAIVAALGDQVRGGLLRGDELRRMTIPAFARTAQDFRAPFAPKGRFESMSIDHLEVFNAEDRFWARFVGRLRASIGVSGAHRRARRRSRRSAGRRFRRAPRGHCRGAAVERARADADSTRLGGVGQARTPALTGPAAGDPLRRPAPKAFSESCRLRRSVAGRVR